MVSENYLIAVKPFRAEDTFAFPVLFINLKAEISKEFQLLLLMVVGLEKYEGRIKPLNLVHIMQKVGDRVAEVLGVKQENIWAAGKDNATR